MSLLQLKILSSFEIIQSLPGKFFKLSRILETVLVRIGMLKDDSDSNKSTHKIREIECT